MKKIIFVIILIFCAIGIVLFLQKTSTPRNTELVPGQNISADTTPENFTVEVIAENLEIPWDIAFLPDGDMLVTERTGTVLLLRKDGTRKEIVIESVAHRGEGGLLGMTLHPDFEQNNYVYLYMTATDPSGNLLNRVERFVYADEVLTSDKIIVSEIPGAQYHDGGRIRFGPDGKLYVSTGDAGNGKFAQDLTSLAGKILRVNDDGSTPSDNPFVGIPNASGEIYSYGHRNLQGLTWDDTNQLWSTEHGRSGLLSGYDELNLILAGANYGWPDSQGDTVIEGTKSPILHSGPSTTWAPASAAYWGNSIFFGGLRGESLYEAYLDETNTFTLVEHFTNKYGRIRTVVLGPDNMLYFTTSNRDGRGTVREGDDKILRVDPRMFR